MTRTRTLYLAALLLPLVFLGISCAYNVYHRATMPVYDVVLKPYDPRDLLHGRYLQFRYDWDHAATRKPAGKSVHDLPQSGRFYLPERAALDLQQLMTEHPQARFVARVGFMGKRATIFDIIIDGKPWRDVWPVFRQGGFCAQSDAGCTKGLSKK